MTQSSGGEEKQQSFPLRELSVLPDAGFLGAVGVHKWAPSELLVVVGGFGEDLLSEIKSSSPSKY